MTHPGVARCRGDGCCLRLRCLLPGGEPDHHCVVPSGQTVETTIPREWKDKKWRYSQCERYAVNSSVSNRTVPCDAGWTYDQSEFHSTIVSDVSAVIH